MLKTTKINSLRRKFWTIANGKTIGYIESISSEGFFFKHPCIYFRQSSSNLSNTNIFLINVIDCNNIDKLQRYMIKRKPVCIEFNSQWISSPNRGFMFGQNYATNIEPLDNLLI
jgi:hypothetical protein